MHDGSQGNAMTEIALALAMGFFSLLVLTLVSMGAGSGDDRAAAAAILKPVPAQSGETQAVALEREDTIVIYYRGRFYDTALAPIDPGAIRSDGRVVLALEPTLSMSEALRAQAQVNADNLVVSVLDERWRTTLAKLPRAGETRP